jgi:hypothetical protein
MVGVLFMCACAGSTSQPGRAAPEDKKPAEEEIDITGHYEYAAYNAQDDKTYKGKVQVSKAGEYYALTYDDGAVGVGIRNGNVFSVSYTYPKGGYSGGGLFTIEKGEKGPVLTGRYTGIPGNGKLGKDKWSFVRPLK